MSQNLIREIDALAVFHTVARGTTLFRRGDPASYVYLVRRGRIVLFWDEPASVRRIDALAPGHIIGLPAAFNGEYSVSGKAVQESELGYVPTAKLMDLLSINPNLLREVSRLLAEEVARMREICAQKSRTTGLHRVR